ncbi:odorant receptor 4 [Camponotus floridanus]|uniref:odorant receptor 4 n=1 Tax=Camponotus floridanus TaxID=104421 RepID=UPI000DC6BD91|nr:odorant receptor 4 [Camponotus floridanus]
MFANKYYESDIKYTFEINRFFFRILGMWPFPRTNSFIPEIMETVLLNIACFTLLLSEIIPTIIYIFIVLKDIHLRLKVMGIMLFTIATTIKYGYVLLYKKEIKNCLKLIDEDWRNVVNSSARILMIDRARIGRRLIIMCAIFVYLNGVAMRVIVPLSSGKIITPQNITIRPLPSVAHFIIFDVQRTPAYEMVFFLQSCTGIVRYTVTVATFGFITLSVMHFCSQLDILVTLISNFVNEHKKEYLNKRLAVIVEHQIKTRNFLRLVQNATQYPSLVEIMGSSVLMCFVGYYIILDWENHNAIRICSYIFAIVMFLFNVFIYCYMGEQVVEQEKKIALTVCTLEWYRLPNEKAKALILIMGISDTSLNLKAGKFIDLSFKTFGNVVKMTVTYLNLIRSIE